MKVFLLGMDGMTLRIVEPYVRADLLPNFKKIINGGASGILCSTIPPITGPAWVSLATGKNPGKHHVFEFRKRNGYETSLITRNTSPHAEPVWNILSRNKRTVKILNVPFTYPPDEVNGIMVSGLMTPNTRSEFTYPSELKKEIQKLIPDYRIDINTREIMLSGNKSTLLKEVFKNTQEKRQLMGHFLDQDPCELFFITFVGPDRVQHFMWDEVLAMKPECIEYYKLLDDVLGDILDRMDDDSILFVVSDHGFDEAKKTFSVNKCFEERGLLHLKKIKKAGGTRSKLGFVKFVLFFYKIMFRMGLFRLKRYLPPSLVDFVKNFLWSIPLRKGEIDWEKTKVFSLLWHGINVNLKGREPSGNVEMKDYDNICSMVEDELCKAVDPDTGRNIVKSVHRCDRLYATTQEIDHMPDMVFLLNRGYAVRNDLLEESVVSETGAKEWNITGCHDMDGLFLGYGKNIKNTKVAVEIYDVMPTILYMLGLAIPEDVDGRVLYEVIKPEFREKKKIQFEKARASETAERRMRDDEAEEVEKHLRGLGYLS